MTTPFGVGNATASGISGPSTRSRTSATRVSGSWMPRWASSSSTAVEPILIAKSEFSDCRIFNHDLLQFSILRLPQRPQMG
nr:hypothetical protein [Tanacetum cinerariifolium]